MSQHEFVKEAPQSSEMQFACRKRHRQAIQISPDFSWCNLSKFALVEPSRVAGAAGRVSAHGSVDYKGATGMSFDGSGSTTHHWEDNRVLVLHLDMGSSIETFPLHPDQGVLAYVFADRVTSAGRQSPDLLGSQYSYVEDVVRRAAAAELELARVGEPSSDDAASDSTGTN